MSDQPKRILTVSELTLLVRDRLEERFPDIWVEGEISNLRTPSSGHLYFTLKDERSQLRAVLFKAGAQRLRFALREGLHVIVRGNLTVYEPRGEYQVVLDYVEPKGIGALQIALEQLKEKLAREGLFDHSRKRPLPFLPRRIGVVTSLSGAAIRDILAVLTRRCPSMSVLIVPVPVQGEAAAPLISGAIRALSASGKVDVMIVGRGGGSLEDLWCFNEEVVVRAIAESVVPVVSAVGHEIDYTLADFAADYRAPTPSAAAEAVVPVLDDLVETILSLQGRSAQAMRSQLSVFRQQVQDYDRVAPLLKLLVQRDAQRLDDSTERLGVSLGDVLSRFRQRMVTCRHELQTFSPLSRVRNALVLVPQLLKRAEQRMLSVLAFRRQAVRSIAAALNGLSPLAILGRGYSIVQTVPDGLIVRRARDLSVGDEIRARLAEGQVLASVRQILPDS
ncbi:MAG TPA: exodeoxyribonuclease VII large subunit [Nitrospiraceae bacterium]|nr:exodeoxyribonuclease VII large subunit [Nitrospiraceae bacterium]